MIKIGDYEIKPTMFPDGTSQVWHLPPDLLLLPQCTVHWKFESEAEIIHLAQLKTLLDESRVIADLDIRTLPYARQDKNVNNETTFALHSFAKLLNAMRWNRVHLHDPHSRVALDSIERSFADYYVYDAGWAAGMFEADCLCFPDAGALAKYKPMFPGERVVSATASNRCAGAVEPSESVDAVKTRRASLR